MRDRRSILFVIDSLTGGGAERMLVQVANALNTQSNSVSILMTLSNEIKQDVRPGIPVHFLPDVTPTPPKDISLSSKLFDHLTDLLRLGKNTKIKRPPDEEFCGYVRAIAYTVSQMGHYLHKDKPTCIVSFLPLSNIICLLACKIYSLDIPLIISDRNYFSLEINTLKWAGAHRRLVRCLYPTIDRYIAVTEISAFDMCNNFNVPKWAVSVIPNGVNLEKTAGYAKERNCIKKAEVSKEIILIAAGRLAKQKGFDILLEALSLTRNSNWKLLLLGVGPDEISLKKLTLRFGLQTKVNFIGYQSDPWKWFTKADVFVLSSRWEGFPNVLIEAMAIGLPVIAADCLTGPGEILENGRWGRLVKPGSAIDLAIAIDEMIENSDIRSNMSALSSQRSTNFDIKRTVERYSLAIKESIDDNKHTFGTGMMTETSHEAKRFC